MMAKIRKPKPECPTETPWGPPQEVKKIAEGLFWIDTASHGGYWLSPELNKKVPLRDRRRTFCQLGMKGWYEEDEDSDLIHYHFRDRLFPEEAAQEESVRNHLKDLVKHITKLSSKKTNTQQ